MSGRNDLVRASGTDNGANFYINSGIRMLENRQDHRDTEVRHIIEIAVGDYNKSFRYCRSIEDNGVWLAGTDGRFKMYPKPLDYIRSKYSKPSGDLTQGTPKYWALNVIRLSTSQIDDDSNTDLGASYDHDDILFGDNFSYTGIIFMPPANDSYTMNIFGKWYSKQLSLDADINFWTSEYPDIVILAAMYKLETLAYRNTEGAKDYMNSIIESLGGIDNSMVEMESRGMNQIIG